MHSTYASDAGAVKYNFIFVWFCIFVLIFIQFGCGLFGFYSLLVLLNVFSSGVILVVLVNELLIVFVLI